MAGWTVTQIPTDYTLLIIIVAVSVGIVILKEFIQWKIKSKKPQQITVSEN